MNSLSWLIYLADVTGSLGVTTRIGVFVCFVWFVGYQTAALAASDFGNEEDIAPRRATAMKAVPVAIALLIANVFIPATETVYAIAASEMGEKALVSKTGSKAVAALNAWLDRQISGEPETKGESK